MLAASKGHLEVCEVLLEAGANPGATDQSGNDAVAIAQFKGYSALVELLNGCGTRPAPSSHNSTELPENRSAKVSPNPSVRVSHPEETATERQFTSRTVGQVQPRGAANGVANSKPDEDEHCFDLSGWQEEVESEPPPDDASCAEESATLQNAVSRHSPVDSDHSWDDVDIELPEWTAQNGRQHSQLATEMSTAVRTLVLRSLRNARIDGSQVTEAVTISQDPVGPETARVEANLRLALRDAGVVIDDDSFIDDPVTDLVDEDEHQFGDAASEVLGLFHVLQSSSADPLVPYTKSLPNDRLSRDDERLLGETVEQGTRQILSAIASSPAAVSKLLSDARLVLDGSLQARSLVDGNDAAQDHEALNLTDGELDEPSIGVGPTAPKLAAQLNAIVDACERRQVDHDALAAVLLDTKLAADYRHRLERIAAQDSTSGGAAAQLAAGLTKVLTAKRRLILANLKLVIWVAKQYGGLPLADKVQAGNIGLMRAADRFDHTRGTKFSTYAVWWIRQTISRANADTNRVIRLPVHVTESLRKVVKAQDESRYTEGCEPDAYRIATSSGLPVDTVRKMLRVPDDPLSMNDPEIIGAVWDVAEESESSPEKLAMRRQTQLHVHQQLDRLPDRERAVLHERFGIDGVERTLEEVGKRFGVTRERIRQIEAKALRKLRHPSRSAHLADFLD